MLLCAIVRLCGGLWFSADLTSVKEPGRITQEIISAALLIFELIFIYKILCRTKWIVCFAIAVAETLTGILIGYITNGNETINNLFYMFCILFIPVLFRKTWFSLLENAILYIISMIYGLLFCVGRIGNVSPEFTYNFIYGVLGAIDFKLFFVALYLFLKNYGGIKLWKSQKRLIFQTDPKK